MNDRNPLVQLFIARLKEFSREPEVIFWVFGFPILLAVGLGIAFRNKPADEIAVGVIDGPGAETVLRALETRAHLPADGGSNERAVSSDATASSQSAPGAPTWTATIVPAASAATFKVEKMTADESEQRLRLGKIAIV